MDLLEVAHSLKSSHTHLNFLNTWITSCYVTMLHQDLKWPILWHPMSSTVNIQCIGENHKGLLKPTLKTCQLWDILIQPCGMYTPMNMEGCVNPGEKRAFSSQDLWSTSGAEGITEINIHASPYSLWVCGTKLKSHQNPRGNPYSNPWQTWDSTSEL